MQQLSEKDQRALRSSKLLRTCTERKFSWSTIEMISDILAPTVDQPIPHDQMVIKILDILENNDTEEKVIQSLEEEIQIQ